MKKFEIICTLYGIKQILHLSYFLLRYGFGLRSSRQSLYYFLLSGFLFLRSSHSFFIQSIPFFGNFISSLILYNVLQLGFFSLALAAPSLFLGSSWIFLASSSIAFKAAWIQDLTYIMESSRVFSTASWSLNAFAISIHVIYSAAFSALHTLHSSTLWQILPRISQVHGTLVSIVSIFF
jgi:hypothetical protein